MTPTSLAAALAQNFKSNKAAVLRSAVCAVFLSLVLVTVFSLRAIPENSNAVYDDTELNLAKVELLDRFGSRLDLNFETRWNLYDRRRLEEYPEILKQAFVASEDRRFWDHRGVDWQARLASLWAFLRTGRLYRGASTLTEQVVRILHPRPRTVWSRWLETFEAYQLEQRWDKLSILEFYLNQVPYGSERRGVVQATNLLFDRDIDTLNPSECLALAVLVRAPSHLALERNRAALNRRVFELANHLNLKEVVAPVIHGGDSSNGIQAPDFVRQVRARIEKNRAGLNLRVGEGVTTTLHGGLQKLSHHLLQLRLAEVQEQKVEEAAVLVVDVLNGDILAYTTAGPTDYDMIRRPRQPGSTMKPFLYALALEKGWTPAQVLIDEPLSTAVGRGLHSVRNYSRTHYGPITLRSALGNSLNVPAVKTAKYVGTGMLLQRLKTLGITSLHESADHYGEGLALGSGEVSLFELVQAYTVFAKQGFVQPLRMLQVEPHLSAGALGTAPVFESEVTSQIADILADPKARSLEFGRGSILNFQSPVAVKTGTSTDFRDAWAIGFNSRYLVGVWTGRTDGAATLGNSGAKLPALILRSLWAEMEKLGLEAGPLPIHPRLTPVDVCFLRSSAEVTLADESCARYTEYFLPESVGLFKNAKSASAVEAAESGNSKALLENFEIRFPISHLEIALDPRIPRSRQELKFEVSDLSISRPSDQIHFEWRVNGQLQGVSRQPSWPWRLEPGPQELFVKVVNAKGLTLASDSVEFIVK